jgi:hypothetical protein
MDNPVHRDTPHRCPSADRSADWCSRSRRGTARSHCRRWRKGAQVPRSRTRGLRRRHSRHRDARRNHESHAGNPRIHDMQADNDCWMYRKPSRLRSPCSRRTRRSELSWSRSETARMARSPRSCRTARRLRRRSAMAKDKREGLRKRRSHHRPSSPPRCQLSRRFRPPSATRPPPANRRRPATRPPLAAPRHPATHPHRGPCRTRSARYMLG